MEQRRSQSIVQDKSFRFAVQLVGYIRRQPKDHVSLVLTRQLLRSGTSIGANVEEALGGQSSKDFISKLAIAAKEARETGYWLRLLRDSAAQTAGTDQFVGRMRRAIKNVEQHHSHHTPQACCGRRF